MDGWARMLKNMEWLGGSVVTENLKIEGKGRNLGHTIFWGDVNKYQLLGEGSRRV